MMTFKDGQLLYGECTLTLMTGVMLLKCLCVILFRKTYRDSKNQSVANRLVREVK